MKDEGRWATFFYYLVGWAVYFMAKTLMNQEKNLDADAEDANNKISPLLDGLFCLW
jgi:hypothetical protein